MYTNKKYCGTINTLRQLNTILKYHKAIRCEFCYINCMSKKIYGKGSVVCKKFTPSDYRLISPTIIDDSDDNYDIVVKKHTMMRMLSSETFTSVANDIDMVYIIQTNNNDKCILKVNWEDIDLQTVLERAMAVVHS